MHGGIDTCLLCKDINIKVVLGASEQMLAHNYTYLALTKALYIDRFAIFQLSLLLANFYHAFLGMNEDLLSCDLPIMLSGYQQNEAALLVFQNEILVFDS